MKITQSKVACVSDIHFGVHQNADVWHTIGLDFAKWFKQQIVKENIKDIIIAGDVFHNRNEISVNTLHMVNEVFNLWKDFNILIIPGNHDVFYKDRYDVHSLGLLDGWDNITVIDEPTQITAFNKTINFVPWAADFKKLPKSNILFGHLEINNFKVTQTKTCEHGINSVDILDYGDLIITGHFHFTEARKYSNGTILYLGCPYEMYWGDYGDKKGFYILDIESQDYQFVENNITPKHKKIRLTELIEAGGISLFWENNIPNNIISFVVDKNVDPDKLSLISTKLQSFKPLSYKIDYETTNTISSELSGLDLGGIDIPNNITEFVNLIDNVKYKQETIDYIIDLYNTLNK